MRHLHHQQDQQPYLQKEDSMDLSNKNLLIRLVQKYLVNKKIHANICFPNVARERGPIK